MQEDPKRRAVSSWIDYGGITGYGTAENYFSGTANIP
jgi:hypothetical protein